MGKTPKLRTEPPIGGTAIVTAQAIDTLSQAERVPGLLHTIETATEVVLKERQEAGLPIPTPVELVEALDYLKRMRDRE